MNITIIQDSSRQELLGSSGADIIEKLYQIAVDFNNTLTLEGNIISTNAYGYQVDYLNTNYGPNFIVNATNRYIHFEDPNMESYLASMGIGTDGKVTEAQAAAVTVIANASNSTITKFNELKYFTNITSSKGGWTGNSSGYMRFTRWTALQEIDISNLTSIGHKSGLGYEDTFYSCSSLKKVKASDKLKQIGFYAFGNCTHLEEITGLEDTIELSSNAFIKCSMLTDESFENVQFKLPQSRPDESCFQKCILLQNITLDPSTTYIPGKTFRECSSLKNVYGLDNINEIFDDSFYGCSNLENLSGLSGEIIVHNNAFYDCVKLPADTFENCTSIEFRNGGSFYNCSLLTTLPPFSGSLTRTFTNCSNLEIDLTNLNEITHIGPETFNTTKKTEGVVNLPNLDSGDLGYRAFKNTKISKVLNLGSCGRIQEEAFSGCTDLTEVDLSNNSMIIGTSAFENCSSLQSINVETVTGLERYAFAGCSQLELLYFKELLHPSSVSNNNTVSYNGLFVGGGLFIYAPKLQDINGGFDQGGNNVRGLFVKAGSQATMTDKNIIYFKNLSSVETGAFCGGNVKHLIINNTTPPTVTAYWDKKQNLLIDVSGAGVSRSVVQNVWVPDSAVNTYKADTYWGEFGNKIQGLSGMSKVATKALWDQLSASAKEDTLIEEYM